VENRALCAIAQAESVRYKLLEGLAVRRACYGVLRYIMENGAKGVEIIVSGKLRAQRAKAMKFKDGYMIKSGHAATQYVDQAVRHVNLKQGVLGIKVKIQMDYDPTGKQGPSTPLPDVVEVSDGPKDEPLTKTEPQSQPAAQQGYGQDASGGGLGPRDDLPAPIPGGDVGGPAQMGGDLMPGDMVTPA